MTIAAGFAAALTLLVQTPLTAWTWTLYENTGTVVLAHEVPDTAQLRATLECEPGSGAVEVVLYEFGTVAEFARLRAGRTSCPRWPPPPATPRTTTRSGLCLPRC